MKEVCLMEFQKWAITTLIYLLCSKIIPGLCLPVVWYIYFEKRRVLICTALRMVCHAPWVLAFKIYMCIDTLINYNTPWNFSFFSFPSPPAPENRASSPPWLISSTTTSKTSTSPRFPTIRIWNCSFSKRCWNWSWSSRILTGYRRRWARPDC